MSLARLEMTKAYNLWVYSMEVDGRWYSFNKKAAKAVCDENDSAALSLEVELFSNA